MGTQIRSLRTLVCAAGASLLIIASPAQAIPMPYVVMLEQVGTTVVATGSGAFDLTGLSFVTNGTGTLNIIPSLGQMVSGSGNADIYQGTISGPSNFGSGGPTSASSGTGSWAEIQDFAQQLLVPTGYVSGNALSNSATWNGATLKSLGVTPGTYTWTWGVGPDQSFTLDAVAPAAAPDSGSTFGLLLVALGGLFGVGRFRLVHSA